MGPQDRTVSGETAAKAYRLLMEFLVQQAGQFYDRFFRATYEDEEHIRWVAGHILAHRAEKIRRRDLARAHDALGTDDAVEAVMEQLHKLGWVDQGNTSSAGGGSRWWMVNPQVHVLFAEQAEKERKDRSEKRREAGMNIASFAKRAN